jgi:hypothetical protein
MEVLDHVVINVLHEMDEAASLFSALGFMLTPLGRHSLGSINHLMVTPSAYLELVGVPLEGKQRQEVLDSPLGLNGLVYRITDADLTYGRLREQDLSPSEPVSFSRPVDLDGRLVDASFRTVKVSNVLFPAGRVYFCQHLTPELVWREEWMTHPNGFCGFERIVVDSTDPEADAKLYARASAGHAVAEGKGWRMVGNDLTVDVQPAVAPRFSALGLKFAGLDDIARRASSLEDVEWSETAEGAILGIPRFNLRIECRAAA